MTADAFSRARRKLASGQPIVLQVWSDSTGNGASSPREWPYLLADWLATEYPNSPVGIYPYDTTNNVYSAKVVISTGAVGPSIEIYNFAIPGALFQTGLGNLWVRSLRMGQADCTIVNLGLNHAGRDEVLGLGEIAAGLESYRQGQPETPLLVIKQNPFKDGAAMDKVVRSIDRLHALRDFTICDVHSAFVAAGKPPSLYLSGDNTHPSQAGQHLYLDAITALWAASPAGEVYPSPSVLTNRISDEANLIRNGRFLQWSGAVPDCWNAGGAGILSATKDTNIVSDADRAYSLRLNASGGYTHLYQDVKSHILANCRGRAITLAAKRYLDPYSGAGQGRIFIQISSQTASVYLDTLSYATQQNGWVWWAISGVDVPLDATLIRIGLYHDSTGTTPTTPVYFDQVTLFPGILPRSL